MKSSLRVSFVTLLLFRHRRLKPNVFCAVGVVKDAFDCDQVWKNSNLVSSRYSTKCAFNPQFKKRENARAGELESGLGSGEVEVG